MQWNFNRGLQYIQFPEIAAVPQVYHAIFLRDGRNDAGEKMSLNMGLGCGDSDEQVRDVRRRMLALWNTPTGVFTHQVHGSDVSIWSDRKDEPDRKQTVQLQGDALITDRPESALVIQVADCQPVILVDPVHKVVANVHSGWRGSIQNIIGRTVETMIARFGCRPVDLLAGIGPSLGPCCAEFVNYRQEIPESLWSYRGAEDRFNFWQLSRDQLRRAGLQHGHIHVAGICTQCNPHLFFSYRAQRQTGRFASLVGINS